MELESLIEQEAAQENSPIKETNNNDGNFGFVPETIPIPKEKELILDTPAMKIIKSKINKLLCRYPTLIPRSSRGAIEALGRYNEEELENIHQNAITDLQAIRGTPTSEFAINTLCGAVDTFLLPGYLDVCLDDEELNRDIESEFSQLIYNYGTKTQILFRLINNAWKLLNNRLMHPNRIPVRGNNPAVTSIFEDGGDDPESYSGEEGDSEFTDEEGGDYEEEESRRPDKRARTSSL